jgi:2-deoxy-D-gluconate 3-dehydrogenase
MTERMDYRRLYDLSGRTALVVGAGGLGSAAAEALADCGADVAVADLERELAEEAAWLVTARGRESVALPVDVTDPASAEACVKAVVERFGRLDILVNAAGINIRKPAVELAPEEWARIIDVNLNGVFHVTQAAGRVMLEQRYGKVVTISSVSAMCGHATLSAYSASKGGLTMLTKVLAVEWATSGITVNAVAPTYVETPLTQAYLAQPGRRASLVAQIPMGRLAMPEDIAATIVFLACDASRFVTGQTLYVDGGRTAD